MWVLWGCEAVSQVVASHDVQLWGSMSTGLPVDHLPTTVEAAAKSVALCVLLLHWLSHTVVKVLLGFVQVKANGLVVFVPKYGIEGPVYLVTKDAANNVNQQVSAVCIELVPH